MMHVLVHMYIKSIPNRTYTYVHMYVHVLVWFEYILCIFFNDNLSVFKLFWPTQFHIEFETLRKNYAHLEIGLGY